MWPVMSAYSSQFHRSMTVLPPFLIDCPLQIHRIFIGHGQVTDPGLYQFGSNRQPLAILLLFGLNFAQMIGLTKTIKTSGRKVRKK